MDRFASKETKLKTFLVALAADYLNKYFKHVYLKCGNVLVSIKVNIQW